MSTTYSSNLPTTHRTLRLTSQDTKPSIQTIPTPKSDSGSVVIRVLVTSILSYQNQIYPPTNIRGYPYPLPMTGGSSAIGRIAAVGPDTTTLEEGQLVIFDSFIHARDDPSAAIISGIIDGATPAAKKLMRDAWRDGSYAEYLRAPLENVFALNEERLLGSPGAGSNLGYKVEDLMSMAEAIVPYGGLRDISLQPGETVIVAPATGPFGGAAVRVALAMGARVIAMGRNQDVLKKLATHDRVDYVPITGNMEEQTEALKKFGPIDAYFDISPPEAAASTHFKSCMLALKHSGRVSLMGGIGEDISIPARFIMVFNITIKGKWMYERDDVLLMIKMVESGVFKLGPDAGMNVVGKFSLEQWEEAFKLAAERNKPGEKVVFVNEI